MRMRGAARRIRKDDRPTRAQIGIGAVQCMVVERGEVVRYLQSPAVFILIGGAIVDGIVANFQKAVAVVAVDGELIGVETGAVILSIKGAIAGLKIEEALWIDHGDATPLPDAAQAAVGRRVQYSGEGKRT